MLAIVLLRRLPRVGDDLSQFADRVAPFGWVIGIVALVAGGYYLIVHAVSGPHLFHFEVIGIGVGLALLWSRLTGHATRAGAERGRTERGRAEHGHAATGLGPLLAVFGIIPIAVGVQGLFTPDG